MKKNIVIHKVNKRHKWLTRIFLQIFIQIKKLFSCLAFFNRQFKIFFVSQSHYFRFHIRLSYLLLIFLVILSSIGIFVFIYLLSGSLSGNWIYKDQEVKLLNIQKKYQTNVSEILNMQKTHLDLSNTLTTLQRSMGFSNQFLNKINTSQNIVNSSQTIVGSIDELSILKDIQSNIVNINQTLVLLNNTINNNKLILDTIPNLWPIRVRGYLTLRFGMNIHPITGRWYMHKGTDIAYFSGTPILAITDGYIVGVEFDPPGRGLYITMSHKYGFTSRYAHLSQSLVNVGQFIKRGQVIALMGSTGESTGPHIHLELMLGTQYLDALNYLNRDAVS